MVPHAPLNTPVLVTFSNGTKAIGTFSHPYGADIAFDFGDACATFFVRTLPDHLKNEDTAPPHITGWQPLPTERHRAETCPVNTLGIVERRDGGLHVGTISDTRDAATALFNVGGNRGSFSFPVNGDARSDDAPVAWYPLPA